MSDTKHNVISVDYKLFKDTAEGELIETTEGKDPLVFLSGMGQMIPDFEANVTSLSKGDTFSFGIEAAKAYGTVMKEAIVDLPQNMIMKDGKLVEEVQIGNILPLQDQDGNVHQAKVVSINEETVTMDANHPLADQDLHFTGSVVEVREATQQEIDHRHAHGPEGEDH
ncbi:MAG: peptidylprolyl isomerase [Cyclobacteriaceae bacterium]